MSLLGMSYVRPALILTPEKKVNYSQMKHTHHVWGLAPVKPARKKSEKQLFFKSVIPAIQLVMLSIAKERNT